MFLLAVQVLVQQTACWARSVGVSETQVLALLHALRTWLAVLLWQGQVPRRRAVRLAPLRPPPHNCAGANWGQVGGFPRAAQCGRRWATRRRASGQQASKNNLRESMLCAHQQRRRSANWAQLSSTASRSECKGVVLPITRKNRNIKALNLYFSAVKSSRARNSKTEGVFDNTYGVTCRCSLKFGADRAPGRRSGIRANLEKPSRI